jgi:hypothetical protein
MSPSLTGPGSWMPENTSSGPLGVPFPAKQRRVVEKPFFCPREVLRK